MIHGLIHNRIILIVLFQKDGIATCFMNSRECMTRLSVNIDVFFSVPRTPSHKTCVTSEDLNCVLFVIVKLDSLGSHLLEYQ